MVSEILHTLSRSDLLGSVLRHAKEIVRPASAIWYADDSGSQEALPVMSRLNEALVGGDISCLEGRTAARLETITLSTWEDVADTPADDFCAARSKQSLAGGIQKRKTETLRIQRENHRGKPLDHRATKEILGRSRTKLPLSAACRL